MNKRPLLAMRPVFAHNLLDSLRPTMINLRAIKICKIGSKGGNGMTSIKLGTFRVVRSAPDGLMTEQVVIQIREMIQQGKLKPGDRLPSERELSKRLGISRASLRAG